MGISLSGIGTVGKEQLISSCSNGEPNWLYIPTKGKSSKTHAEFVSEIKELARRAATQQIRQSTNIFPDRFLVYGQNIYQMLHLIENNYMNRLKIL